MMPTEATRQLTAKAIAHSELAIGHARMTLAEPRLYVRIADAFDESDSATNILSRLSRLAQETTP